MAAALAIQGHHIGLQYLDKPKLRHLDPEKLLNNHPLQLRMSEASLDLLESRLMTDGIKVVKPNTTLFDNCIESRMDRMLDVRMLFSALVDADFLDTEAHFQGDAKGKHYRDL